MEPQITQPADHQPRQSGENCRPKTGEIPRPVDRQVAPARNIAPAAALAASTSGASTVPRENDAPAALHLGGELGRTVFLAGAAGRPTRKIVVEKRGV